MEEREDKQTAHEIALRKIFDYTIELVKDLGTALDVEKELKQIDINAKHIYKQLTGKEFKPGLTADEIRKKRGELGDLILKGILTFEDQTGCTIESVSVFRDEEQNFLKGIGVEVKL